MDDIYEVCEEVFQNTDSVEALSLTRARGLVDELESETLVRKMIELLYLSFRFFLVEIKGNC
jgi:hypothetical protein